MEKIIDTNGTKEIKEALVAFIAITEFLSDRIKDGVGFDDLVATYSKLTSDDVFIKKVKAGYEGLDKIRDELKDLSVEEVTNLGYDISPSIVSLLLKLKKK